MESKSIQNRAITLVDLNILIILSSALSLIVLVLLVLCILSIRGWLKSKTLSNEHERELALANQKLEELQQQLGKSQSDFQQLKTDLECIQRDRYALEKQIAEQNVVLTKEREAFQERIQILEKAEEKLKDTFQSLSSQALKSNNQAFLELANTTFDKLKIAAKGDLELKEKAIHEMVKADQRGAQTV